jgi:hypothetical protein
VALVDHGTKDRDDLRGGQQRLADRTGSGQGARRRRADHGRAGQGHRAWLRAHVHQVAEHQPRVRLTGLKAPRTVTVVDRQA